jgi:uncharacterized protein (DUF488 family)
MARLVFETVGYANVPDTKTLRAYLAERNGMLADIRANPASRRPEYGQEALREVFGDCYLHLPQFGNLNYKRRDLGIRLADPNAGYRRLREVVTSRPAASRPAVVVLMCQCADVYKCHRYQVCQYLATRGHLDIHEIGGRAEWEETGYGYEVLAGSGSRSDGGRVDCGASQALA